MTHTVGIYYSTDYLPRMLPPLPIPAGRVDGGPTVGWIPNLLGGNLFRLLPFLALPFCSLNRDCRLSGTNLPVHFKPIRSRRELPQVSIRH